MLLPIKRNVRRLLSHHSKRVKYKDPLYNLRLASQPAANILIHLSHRDAIHKAITTERHRHEIEIDRKLQEFETRMLKRISEMEDDVLKEISETKDDVLSAISEISNNTEAQQQYSQKEELQVDVKFWGFVKGRVRATGEQEESQVVKQEQI